MFKRVGKSAFVLSVIAILIIAYLAVCGIWYNSDGSKTYLIKPASQSRFGIDISGGIDVTFTPPKGTTVTKQQMDDATTMLKNRLDQKNILDREIYADDNPTHPSIIVRIPHQSSTKTFDPQTEIKELGSMVQLEFKCDDYNNGQAIAKGSDVKSASVEVDPEDNSYEVSFTLKASAVKAFADATTWIKNNNKNLDIYLDNEKIESAGVNDPITEGKGVIQGGFTAASAKKLADQINSGSVPFELVTDNFSTISPTLGKSALNVMVYAGILAFILIALFMIIYYRLPGLIAVIALCGHVAGTLLSISIPQITLTLPGIAGIILSIGMGVDCNVITAERIREELRVGKTIDGAIDAGFDRSFSAIFDGNITVIIAGAILMWLGSGSVKSFGYTLVIGVVFNFIMGLTVSRLMLKSVSRFPFARKATLYGPKAPEPTEIQPDEDSPKPSVKLSRAAAARQSAQQQLLDERRTRLHIDFIGKRRIYYTISIVLIAAGILVSAIMGVKMDISFTGGAILKYQYTGTIDENAARTAAADAINSGSTKYKVSLQTDHITGTNDKLLIFSVSRAEGAGKVSLSNVQQTAMTTALTTKFKDNSVSIYQTNNVNPDMGAQFLRQSILAVALASLLIIIYIWIRFRHIGGLPAGLTAFAALLHDLLMVFAAFSIFRIPLNDNFVAVLLTILGYSVNDTIVIYDRIRENRRLYGTKVHFIDVTNRSINQSFSRSINTTLATFMAIAVVCAFSLVYHLDSITSFALPMMVGVVTGCYSTICIAGPLWVSWVSHKEKQAAALKAQRQAEKALKSGKKA